jgi:hypothetical protein
VPVHFFSFIFTWPVHFLPFILFEWSLFVQSAEYGQNGVRLGSFSVVGIDKRVSEDAAAVDQISGASRDRAGGGGMVQGKVASHFELSGDHVGTLVSDVKGVRDFQIAIAQDLELEVILFGGTEIMSRHFRRQCRQRRARGAELG